MASDGDARIRNETDKRIINLSCLWFMGNGFPSQTPRHYDTIAPLSLRRIRPARGRISVGYSDRTGAIGMRCARVRPRKLCRSARHAWRTRFVAGCSCGRMHNSTRGDSFVMPWLRFSLIKTNIKSAPLIDMQNLIMRFLLVRINSIISVMIRIVFLESYEI